MGGATGPMKSGVGLQRASKSASVRSIRFRPIDNLGIFLVTFGEPYNADPSPIGLALLGKLFETSDEAFRFIEREQQI